MPFLVVSGFYPEPNPDNSLYYDTTVSQEWRNAALVGANLFGEAVYPLSQDQRLANKSTLIKQHTTI